MRYAAYCLCLCVLACPSFCAAADDAQSAKEFLLRWAEALTVGDLDLVVAMYEDSDDVVAIESKGTVRKGIDEIRAMFEGAFKEVMFEEITMDPLKVRASGDVAWAYCRLKASTRVKKDGARWLLEIRGSFVLKRCEDSWEIAHEHFATIAGVPRARPLP